MLQIKLYVAFILAAAAIGPVVAQPLRESTSFKLPNIPRPQRRQSAPPVLKPPVLKPLVLQPPVLKPTSVASKWKGLLRPVKKPNGPRYASHKHLARLIIPSKPIVNRISAPEPKGQTNDQAKKVPTRSQSLPTEFGRIFKPEYFPKRMKVKKQSKYVLINPESP